MYRAVLVALSAIALSAPALGQEPTAQAERVQTAIETWLQQRTEVEGVTGIAAYVSLGPAGPAIEAFAGTTGRASDDPPVDQDTLFGMGSTSKSFAAAIILKLEAQGLLSLDDTIAKWLPQYPAWGDVNIRRLLNMTSGIPNYSETEFIARAWVEEPKRNLTAEELVQVAYPTGTDDLPVTTGYHYSNTNYILAGMIAAKATGTTYPDLVQELIIKAHGLHSTFYSSGTYPPEVVGRLAHGYFENTACAEYQPPDCKQSWNQPLIGRDIREDSTSWMQAAGGAVSNARDVSRWMRAVFEGRVVPPKQQAEWLQMVSTKTGEPISDISPEDPQGFALGLVQGLLPDGQGWFYQGTTLGYRTLYVWFKADNVLVTVQTNSQPNDEVSKLHEAASAIHAALKEQ
ncbi:serine hydrolase [Paracoccus sp. PAR01]|uniref:serine hydrolase domain-containing protein n=1 Tax=Paracoccus sp. PAR01 TaxID=2769282 RepID=UPI00177BE57A|nr:serine hydrolase domain-containing protein [Paracoccus sp. PAR01]